MWQMEDSVHINKITTVCSAMNSKDDASIELVITQSSNDASVQLPPSTAKTICDLVTGMEDHHDATVAAEQVGTEMRSHKKIQGRKWSKNETLSFYAELQKLGPDFTSMSEGQAFKGVRSKKQLRNKYRK